MKIKIKMEIINQVIKSKGDCFVAKKDLHELLKQIDINDIHNEELFEEVYDLEQENYTKSKPKPKREDWE